MAHFGVQKAKMVTLAGIAALSIVAGNAGNIFADDTPLPYQATVDNLTSLKTELAKTPLTREEQTGDSTYGNVIEYVGKRLELQEDLHTNGHTILFAGDEDGDEQWLNFNGHTLFLDCGDYVAYNAIEIRDSSLTMYTNKSTGGIEKPDCSSVATQTNNIHKEGSGTLEIDGGYYNSYGSLIFNHNGIAAAEPSETEKDRGLVINGGTFNAKKSANTSNEPLIQNIWFDSHTQINGGMFNLDGLSLYRSVATGYQSMADYTLEITGGTFNVLSDNETTGLLI